MTDETASQDTPAASAAAPYRTSNKLALAGVGAALLLLAQWFVTQRELDGLSARVSASEGRALAGLEAGREQQAGVRELAAKQALLEARLAETQNQRAALEELYNNVSASREEMVLADVEQLLNLAAQQLEAPGNARAALAAMQQADGQLRQLKGAGPGGLRRALAADMERLRRAAPWDASAIKAQLDQLSAAVDGWPLLQDARVARVAAPVPREQGAWQRLWGELAAGLRETVKVENMEQPSPLLPPEQTYFLRENLKLRLQAARLALVAHDAEGFRQEVQTAQDWLARYFDAKAARVAEAAAVLRRLRAAGSIEAPDISASLKAVRNYRASQGE